MALSRVVRVGDGSTTQFTVDFALGYINESDVTCRVGDEVDGSNDPIYRTITFLSETLVEISGDAPGVGVNVVFDRTVDKEDLVVDFSNGDILDEDNLDAVLEQIMMAVHEVLDGRFGTFDADLDMGGFTIKNLADPVDDGDAAPKSYVDDKLANLDTEVAAAASSATSAAGSATAAATSATNAAASAVSAAASAVTAATYVSAPYPSRALAQAATVDAEVTIIRVEHAGEILVYTRDASGTALSTAGGDNWSPAYQNTVKHYGAVGDGTTDDSTAIQAAIDDTDDVLVLNAGGNYLVETQLQVANKDLVLSSYGATLTQGANDWVLYAHADVTDVTVAASLDNEATVDVSQGGGVTTPVASITFSAPPPFAVGDVVKVGSDDTWTGAGVTGQFWGEPGRVVAVSGNTIYLSKRFQSTVPASPTNIRVGKMAEYKVEIHGLTLNTVDAGDAANWAVQMVKLRGLVSPVLRDIRVVRAWALAIEAQGCYMLDADGINGANLTNDPSNSRYGYLINDKSSCGSIWRGVVGSNCRHVYTTNQDGGLSSSADLRLYGQTIGCQVIGGMATDSLGSAWDTHNDAVDVTFSDCVAIAAVRGEDAVGSGFQIRGKGVALRNCRSIGTKWGVQVLQQYSTAATQGAIIDGFISDTPSAAVKVAGTSGNNVDVRIKNVRARVTDHDHVIEAIYADIVMSDCDLTLAGSVVNSRVISAEVGATIKVLSAEIDLSEHTGTEPYLFLVETDTSDVRAYSVGCVGTWQGIFDLNSNNGTAVTFDAVRCSSRPGKVDAYLNKGASAKLGWNWVCGIADDAFEDNPFYYWDNVFSTAGAKVIDLQFNNADHIIVRIQATVSGAWVDEVTNLGQRLGQKLTFTNRDNSTQQYEIRADQSKGLSLGTSGKFLTNGRGMTLYKETTSYRPMTD